MSMQKIIKMMKVIILNVKELRNKSGKLRVILNWKFSMMDENRKLKILNLGGGEEHIYGLIQGTHLS